MATTKHRDIVVRLTEPQYAIIIRSLALQGAELEQGDSGTKTDLGVLNRAWDAMQTAWQRAGMGF